MTMGYGGGVDPRQFNALAQQVRVLTDATRAAQAERDDLKAQVRDLSVIRDVLGQLQVTGSGGGSGRRNGPYSKMPHGPGHGAYVDLDQIPGRHIPFDFLVDIPIAGGSAETSSQSLYVSMEGPMVCTARMAIFRSQLQFRVQPPEGTAASFFGRSFGRYRPIHSANDIMDANRAFEQSSMYQQPYIGAVTFSDGGGQEIVPVANPMGVNGFSGLSGVSSNAQSLINMLPNFPGTGRPINVSPLSMSAFRTMELDGTVIVEVAGSNFQRTNLATGVPTTFWSSFFSDPWDMGTLDVFEPGETVTLKVTPTHVNNPAFGDINGLVLRNDVFQFSVNGANAGGSTSNAIPSPTTTPGVAVGGWPFLTGQYDGHEGIDGESLSGDTATTPDRVTRVNDGILTIGFKGYRIVQPPQMLR